MGNAQTTIKVTKQTLEFLSTLKIHPRQPYDEVITLLLGGVSAIEIPVSESTHKKQTTLKISKKNLAALAKKKIHPRQPYDEVVLALGRAYAQKNHGR